jgi:hypothetical protein
LIGRAVFAVAFGAVAVGTFTRIHNDGFKSLLGRPGMGEKDT